MSGVLCARGKCKWDLPHNIVDMSKIVFGHGSNTTHCGPDCSIWESWEGGKNGLEDSVLK